MYRNKREAVLVQEPQKSTYPDCPSNNPHNSISSAFHRQKNKSLAHRHEEKDWRTDMSPACYRTLPARLDWLWHRRPLQKEASKHWPQQPFPKPHLVLLRDQSSPCRTRLQFENRHCCGKPIAPRIGTQESRLSIRELNSRNKIREFDSRNTCVDIAQVKASKAPAMTEDAVMSCT